MSIKLTNYQSNVLFMICTHAFQQGEKPVQRDMVFTIDPSVTSKLGNCNLERDVLVTSTGYEEALEASR